ncbi:hypothetical protein AB837_00479 [bacterium AB1]|nr:hypothetical protein AB837_00479 [bacterium AB1]
MFQFNTKLTKEEYEHISQLNTKIETLEKDYVVIMKKYNDLLDEQLDQNNPSLLAKKQENLVLTKQLEQAQKKIEDFEDKNKILLEYNTLLKNKIKKLEQTPNTNLNEKKSDNKNSKSKEKSKFPILLIIVFVIIIGSIVLYFYRKSSQQDLYKKIK